MQKLKLHIKSQNVLKVFVFCLFILMFDMYILNFNRFADSSTLLAIGTDRSRSAETARHIRVAIVQDADSLAVSIRGFYRIINAADKKILAKGKYLKTSVSCGKNGVVMAGRNYPANKLFIEADDPESISINGRKFKGNIQLIKQDNLRLLVINYIELESYIKGILYNEVSHYWPKEALKAQAIVSRTYALYQMSQNKLRDYDLTCDIYSQVYGGTSSERYRTNKAVDETKSGALYYQDKILPAYFHSTCAGHTESAFLLWNTDLEPLRGIPCNFCKSSPHFKWQRTVTLKAISDALIKSGLFANFTNMDIHSIIIVNRDKSGRIEKLKIGTPQGYLIISGKDFRKVIGPNILNSTRFDAHIAGAEAVFEGTGWGHGVGLCQWGAYFMAKEGYDYKQILEYYYPGSKIAIVE